MPDEGVVGVLETSVSMSTHGWIYRFAVPESLPWLCIWCIVTETKDSFTLVNNPLVLEDPAVPRPMYGCKDGY